MIKIVNEAINRKLASMSFTNIITGKVESLSPLQIRINDRIVIGQSFIEPMSLGLSDYSPNFALPLVVGETIQMVRYNNGQRFYVLGKTVATEAIQPATIDYTQLKNIPLLVTTVEEPLEPCEIPIKDEVVLHKISRSGSYNDLVDIPTFAKVASSGKYSDLSGTPTLATVATSGKYDDLTGKPSFDNYVTLDGAQTIKGLKTFEALPKSDVTPSADNHLVNKSYVDTNFSKYSVVNSYSSGDTIKFNKGKVDPTGVAIGETYSLATVFPKGTRFLDVGSVLYEDPTSSFQTTIFGINSGGYHKLAVTRPGTQLGPFSAYGCSIVAATGDTHLFISADYWSGGKARIGGGNGDAIKWWYEIAAAPTTIWTGSLMGGQSITLSNVKRFLKVYVRINFDAYDGTFVYEIDTTADSPVHGGGVLTPFDESSVNSLYISEASFNKDTNEFYHKRIGFYVFASHTYEDRTSRDGYTIYRIDTYD